jgi:glycosyltransferase involved in cell wall biosynthesis
VTVGYFSPLPPERTGVADYAAALLAELRKPEVRKDARVEVAPATSNIALYHLGNNPLHRTIYAKALETPGVVVLHDAVLNHFLLGTLDQRGYVEEFVYNYGEWTRTMAAGLWHDRASSSSDRRYFDYPMLRRIAERSRAVVVHNPAAAAMVREHAARARIVEIPHLFATPELPGPAESIRYRQTLGIDPGDFLFGVFGYLRESKRLVTVLQAFEKLHQENPRTALLVAGQFVSTDLERAVQPMLASGGVFRRPHLLEREFWLAATAVDACINLRYPAAGETSGIAVRLMGMGKPVLLTDGLECSRFPEDACMRIAHGPSELDSLLTHMILLTSMQEVADTVGKRGAAYIQNSHRVEEIGKQYWQLLCEFGS